MKKGYQYAGKYRNEKDAAHFVAGFKGSYMERHGAEWHVFRPREGAPQQGVCADWDGEAERTAKKPKKEPKPRAIRREPSPYRFNLK